VYYFLSNAYVNDQRYTFGVAAGKRGKTIFIKLKIYVMKNTLFVAMD